MNNTTKVAVVFHMNGDQLEGGVYTVEQLVMGQHLEWMKEMELMDESRAKINAAIDAQFGNSTNNIVVTLNNNVNPVTVKELIREIQLAGWLVAEYKDDGKIIIRKSHLD